MGEGFEADPSHIAGYGVLVEESQLSAVMMHVQLNGGADGGFTGLMSLIRQPVDSYVTETCARLADRAGRLISVGRELQRAAWVYSGADRSAYELFDALAGIATGYRDFPDPAEYPAGEDPTAGLAAPEPEDADIREVLDEVGGSIDIIDDAVAWVTGWSPASTLVEPMSGNWTRLERAGEVLIQAGDATELVAGNLTTPLSTVDLCGVDDRHAQTGRGPDRPSGRDVLGARSRLDSPDQSRGTGYRRVPHRQADARRAAGGDRPGQPRGRGRAESCRLRAGQRGGADRTDPGAARPGQRASRCGVGCR
jgi:hypothetical protein